MGKTFVQVDILIRHPIFGTTTVAIIWKDASEKLENGGIITYGKVAYKILEVHRPIAGAIAVIIEDPAKSISSFILAIYDRSMMYSERYLSRTYGPFVSYNEAQNFAQKLGIFPDGDYVIVALGSLDSLLSS